PARRRGVRKTPPHRRRVPPRRGRLPPPGRDRRRGHRAPRVPGHAQGLRPPDPTPDPITRADPPHAAPSLLECKDYLRYFDVPDALIDLMPSSNMRALIDQTAPRGYWHPVVGISAGTIIDAGSTSGRHLYS